MRGIPKKYTEYADKVLKGKITACNYVKLACQRYLNLLKKKEYYLDTQDIDRVVNFISKLKHFTGKDYGKPFILTDWQYFIICHIYGIKRKKDNLRVTRTAYIEVARKSGKALDINTPIPTPDGYKTMGELAVGDKVFDEKGKPTTVTYVTDVMYGHKCYEVTFSDGEVITADADHNWYIDRHRKGKWHIETTQEIVDKGYCGERSDGYMNYYCCVPTAEPVQYEERPLPIDPYAFGVWLGDGSRKGAVMTLNGDDCLEIITQIPYDCRVYAYKDENACEVRYCNEKGKADVKYITSIREVESVPVKCITVDSPNHLYLCGERNTVTHNTSIIAALTLYHLIADREHNASVVLAANSAKQAGLCFEMASKYLKGIDPENKWFKRYRDIIKFDATDSSLHIVAADATKLDGLNCSMYVVDELHEAPNGDVWRVLETSQGARQQPLAIAITTAGFNLSSFCYEMRKSNVDVLEGKSEDDSLFSCIWTLDQGDDVTDKKNWIKANPNLGITNSEEYLEAQLKKAEINPTLRTSVITKLFNCWLSSSEVWIPERYINACQHEFDPPCDLAYLGVDLAASWDLTCVSVMWEYDTEFYFRNYYFLPSQTVAESVNGDLYHQWAQQGFLTLTEGNVTDYDYILNTIMEINKENTIQQVSYDKWNSTQFSISATEQGLNMVPYSMSIGSLNRPTKELARLIVSGKCHMFPNPIDNFCFNNVVIKRDWNENERPTKESYDDKIDGCLSMIMALGGWLTVNHWISDVTPLNFSDF